jgi:hypothetical protein
MDNPDLAAAIEDEVRAKAGLPPLLRAPAPAAAAGAGPGGASEPAGEAAV